MQRNWIDISVDLKLCLARTNESLVEISRASGVNYHAVRRYKIFGVKSQTKNALKLCHYFSIKIAKNAKTNLGFDEIVSAAKSAWDGTAAHAELLVSLIESTKSFKLKKR